MKTLILSLSMLISLPAAAAPLEPLTAGDITTLLEPPARGVRVIELWALYCTYCETNLRAVAELGATGEDVQAVTVNTDRNVPEEAILKRLRSARATGVPARAYAGTSVQRLNYLIDPHWGGELPYTVHPRGRHPTLGQRHADRGTAEGAGGDPGALSPLAGLGPVIDRRGRPGAAFTS